MGARTHLDCKQVVRYGLSALLFLILSHSASAQGWSNGYANQRAVTIFHSQVPNTTRTDFPLLISGTYSYFATTASGGQVTNSNGYDIIFTSDSAGTNPLPYERESYNPVTGAVNFWVQVPSLSPTSDTVIYMFYGNSSVTSDQSNSTAVWDSNYRGVWHLPNGSTLTANDSTSGGHNGSLQGSTTPSAAAGKIDGAASFNGSTAYIDVPGSSSLEPSSAITISGWVNYTGTADTNGKIYARPYRTDSSWNSPWISAALVANASNTGKPDMDLSMGGTIHSMTATSTINDGSWHYVVGTYDGSYMRIYVDGQLGATPMAETGNIDYSGSTAADVTLGVASKYANSGDFVSGVLDEIRVSSIARSADCIATEYNNQSAPWTFYDEGSPTITGLSATTAAWNSSLTITGRNFGSSEGSVTIGGVSASVTGWSANSITVTVPTGAPPGNVVVSVSGLVSNGFSLMNVIPSGWQDSDIGTVGLAGSASFSNGVYTVKGAGTQIGGTADGMNFLYQQLSGDGTITARVTTVPTRSFSQAGVMIRETLAAGSTFAFIQPSTQFLYRTTTGGNTGTSSWSASAPYWIKVVRSGNTFTGYFSVDAVDWTQTGSSQTINMATSVYIGLGVTSASTSTLVTATFDNVSINSSANPAPAITNVSATTGSIGEQIVVYGSGFGTTQGSSLVLLNDAATTINSWSTTSITFTVPAGATSGYLTVCLGPGMIDSNPVMFDITSQPLPSGWLDDDIGTVGLAGSATYSNGVFTVKAAGVGMDNSGNDGMHLTYLPLSGDGTIIARIATVPPGNAIAGIMIRESLASGSTFALVRPSTNFMYRTTTGGGASSSSSGGGSPYWLKLVRSGNSFSAYFSIDTVDWTQVGSAQTISMATNVLVGLGVTSTSTSTLATAAFDNVSVTSSANPAPVISSVSATTASIGEQVIITGTGFGSSQNGSAVLLNDAPMAINSWSSTSVAFTVAAGAMSGYLTVSLAPDLVTSNPVTLDITTQPLPSGWLDADIGTVGLAGSATYSNGVFTVQGAGIGMDNSGNDGMHLAYLPLSGDGTIIARVATVPAGNAIAGIMIRESLASGSTFALVRPSTNFMYRTTTGGGASSSSSGGGSPYWLKLVRAGNSFTAYYSVDNTSDWTQVGSSQTINMATTVLIGLGVTSTSTSTLATATFDNVSVTSSTDSPPVISSISATTAPAGALVTIYGSGFGATQGASLVSLNGTAAYIEQWSSTSITIGIPNGATSGYLFVAVAPNLIDSNAVYFQVTSQALPSGWLDQDVGVVGMQGSATYASSTAVFTVNGAGSQIWSSADAFHFVYQPLSGDGTIVARVDSLTGTSYRQAGVMIRETMSQGATTAFMSFQGGGGSSLVYRTSTGGNAASYGGASETYPYWCMLIRSGNTFKGYISPDGVNWTQVGSSQTINMVTNVYIGLAVSSDSTSTMGTGTFDNVVVSPTAAFITPVINSLAPPAGPVGGSIVVSGTDFGSSQNGSEVTFNGLVANVSYWSSTSITATVPSNTTSGPVVVTVGGVASNSVQFSIIEAATISGISPTLGPIGSSVTITGTGFGPTQSSSLVHFFGETAITVTNWSDTSVTAVVPAGATTGHVYVSVAGLTATGPVFSLTGTTNVTDSLGNTSYYDSVLLGGQYVSMDSGGSGCSTCSIRGSTASTYDANGNVLTATDPAGHTTTYTYDSADDMLSQSIPLNGTTSATTAYTYNTFGEVLTMTDPLGNVTTNTYDTHGNLLTVTAPAPNSNTAASVTSFAYNSLGELTSITDPLNNVTSMTYTTAGLIATIKDAQNNVTTYGYDARGDRTSVTDALNHTTTFTYDAMSRLTKITYPDSTNTSFAYDVRGRRTSVTDQNGKTTSYAYDDADRLTSVTDAANHATAYAYDTEDNLTSITDANSNQTGFTYDAFGRMTKTTFPSSLAETYQYDADNNLTQKTDRNGNTIQYLYDALNRMTQKTYPDTTNVEYTYDLVGKVLQVNDPTGTYAFAYDNMGRLIGTTTSYSFLTSRNFTTGYTYDAASNRTGFTDPENGSTSYSYDTLNRVTSLAPPSAFGSGSFGFGYDALSRRTQMTRPNSVTTNYAYDNLSRLTSILHQLSGSTIDGATYTVDNAGNRLSKTDNRTGIASSYTYDPIYELTQVTQGATTTESYSYDAVGNRTASLGVASYTTNASNELTATSNATYTYDSNGNTLTKTDSAGTTSYAWDFENRLASVTLPGSSGMVSFRYDPFARRIYKSSSSATSVYAYDLDDITEETNASGAALARYSQTENIDEPLAMLRGGATSFYNADGLGSITSLSNAAGALAQTYTFDSFGNQMASSGSLINPFQYTARDSDPETGLNYYRARYYDPTAGRFLGEDPLAFLAGANFYRYVSNRVTGFSDPFGESQKDIQRLIDMMDIDVQDMIKKGIRHPGKGDTAADENNIEKTLYIITRGRLGKPYLSCNEQDQYLELHKVGDLLSPKKLDDTWTMTEVPGTNNCVNGYCTHWVLRLTSSNRSDPDLFLDPWRDTSLTVSKGSPYDGKKSH